MAAFRSSCLLFCATVLCGLVASTRIETDLAAEEAAEAVAPSLALEGSAEEPVDRIVREADPNPGKKRKSKNGIKGKGEGNKAKKGKQSNKKRGSRKIKANRNKKKNKVTKKGNKATNKKIKFKGAKNEGKKPKSTGRGRKAQKNAKKGKKPKKKVRGKKAKKYKMKENKFHNKGRGKNPKEKNAKNKIDKKNKKNFKKTLKKKGNRKTKNKAAGGKGQSGRQTRNSTIALSCLKTAIRLLKFQKDNVANFLTRHARQIRQNALTTKKSGKKGEFAEPSARLVQAGGGDKQNLSCSGSTTSIGAKQLLNITTRLGACQKGIQDACKPPAGINQTFMEQCYNKAMGFNKTLTGCVITTLDGADACSCFTDAKLVGALTDLKSCKGEAEAKLAAKTRTACLKKVRECKADVTKAGQLQYGCKITLDEMIKTLAQILNNNATVTAAMAKVKALTGVGRAGSPASPTRMRRAEQPQHRQADQAPEIPDFVARHSGHRVRRQATTSKATTAGATTAGATTAGATTAGATTAGATTAGATTAGATTAGATTAGATTAGTTAAGATTTAAPTCGDIATSVAACAAAITNTPAMGDKIIEACTITVTAVTCTTAEIVILQLSVDSVTVAQMIFMAFKISLETEIKESSGTTPTSAALAAAVAALPGNAGATAAAAGRNRNILRKMIMDRLRK